MRHPFSAALVAFGGLLGAAGVAISAAAAHRGGGDLATTAGLFCLLHAGAVIALAAYASASPGRNGGILAGAMLLVIGTAAFAGDLAATGLKGVHPVPFAAPIGGMLMLLGWIVAALSAVVAAARQPR